MDDEELLELTIEESILKGETDDQDNNETSDDFESFFEEYDQERA